MRPFHPPLPADDEAMDPAPTGDVSRLLVAWQEGDEAAADRLAPLVYAELQRIASRQLGGEGSATLQTTALVHEAWVRLVGADVAWNGRGHFLALAARTMRRVLVDHARSRRAAKRGGDRVAVTLDEGLAGEAGDVLDVLAVDEALGRLAGIDERKAKAIELRYFGGMSHEEIADGLGTSLATVDRDLRFATAWLRAELTTE